MKTYRNFLPLEMDDADSPGGVQDNPQPPSQYTYQDTDLHVQAASLSRSLKTDGTDEATRTSLKRPDRRQSLVPGVAKITVQDVLEDLYAPPFSMRDFQLFLMAEHSEENIDFFLALKEYERKCSCVPATLLRNISTTDSKPDHILEDISTSLFAMIDRFFTTGVEQELNVPANLVRVMKKEVEGKNFHPDIFKKILENVFTMLRLSSFPNFYKAAAMRGECRLRATIEQVLDNLLPSPMSFSEFNEFCIDQTCKSAVDFYLAVRSYRHLFPDSANSPTLTSSTLEKNPATKFKEIVKTFISKDAPNPIEVSLTHISYIEEMERSASFHKGAFDGIAYHVLQKVVPTFEKFQATNESNEAKRRNQACASVAENGGMMVARENSRSGELVPQQIKMLKVSEISVQQVVDDAFYPPFSHKDFKEFLYREHSEENIEFFLALREYTLICSNVPDNLLRHAVFTSETTQEMKYLGVAIITVLQILDRFLHHGSILELNIPAKIKQPLMDNIRFRQNIHPEVFADAMGNVFAMLKLSSFPSFCKDACGKGKIIMRLEADKAPPRPLEVEGPALSNMAQVFNALKNWTGSKSDSGKDSSTFGGVGEEAPVDPRQYRPPSQRNSQAGFISADIYCVLEDNYEAPFSLADFKTFLDSEHSSENMKFFCDLNEYKSLCKSIPDFLLRDKNSRIEYASQFGDILSQIRTLLDSMVSTYFSQDSDTELNMPSTILKPLHANINERGNIHPEVFARALENVVQMMRLSSLPNFQKLALAKGRIQYRTCIENVLADRLPSPYSLMEFRTFLSRSGSESGVIFYPIAKEYETLCAAGTISDLAKTKSTEIINSFFAGGSRYQLNIPFTLRVSILEDTSIRGHVNPAALSKVVDVVVSMLRETSFKSFCKEIEKQNGSARQSVTKSVNSQNSSFEVLDTVRLSTSKFNFSKLLKSPTRGRARGDQTASLPAVQGEWANEMNDDVAAEAKDEVKVPLGAVGEFDEPPLLKHGKSVDQIYITQILDDQLMEPFSLEDFHKFLLHETRLDLLDFHFELQTYKKLWQRIPAELWANLSSVLQGSLMSFDLDRIKQASARIKSRLSSPDACSNLGITAGTTEQLLSRLESNAYIEPDAFTDCANEVVASLNSVDLPKFLKLGAIKGPAKFRPTVKQVLAGELPSPLSKQEFHDFLRGEGLEVTLEFYDAVMKIVQQCQDSPSAALEKLNASPSEELKASSLEISKLLENPALPLDTSTKSTIIDQVKTLNNIPPRMFLEALEKMLNQLSVSTFPKFVREANLSKKLASATRPTSSIRETTDSTTQRMSVSTADTSDPSAQRSKFAISKLLKKPKKLVIGETCSLPVGWDGDEDQSLLSPDTVKPRPLSGSSGDRKPISFTVIQVLEDQLSPPFSQKGDVRSEHSEENFAFYMAVKDYQRQCDKIPVSARNDTTIPNSDPTLDAKLTKLKSSLDQIYAQFFAPGAPIELNIPSKIMKPLISALELKSNINSAIFDNALDNVLTMMRLSSFPNFCKAASVKGEPKLRPTVLQALDDMLPPPMSRQDFRDFLCREYSEENFEFYIKLRAYEKLCKNIPDNLLRNSNEPPTNLEDTEKLEAAKTACKELIQTFVAEDGEFELNIPIKVKRPLTENVSNFNIHPDVFQDAFVVVLTMLRLSSFPNFIKEVAKKQMSEKAALKKDEEMDGEAESAQPKKPRPKSWIDSIPSLKSPTVKIATDFGADEIKVALIEVLNDEYQTPFSSKDYNKFAADEGEDRGIEFYHAVKAYQAQSAPIPDDQLLNSKSFKSEELSKAFFAVIQIVAKFLAKGSRQEINIPPEILKAVLAEVNEKRNLHPQVFDDAVESVLNTHKTLVAPKFFKAASAKGTLRPNKKKVSNKPNSSRQVSKSSSKLENSFSGEDESTLPPSGGTDSQRLSSVKSDNALESVISTSSVLSEATSPSSTVRRASSLSKFINKPTISALDRLEDEVRNSVMEARRASVTNQPSALCSPLVRRASILEEGPDTAIKFGVLQVLEDQFSTPFSMKDLHRFLIAESSDENIDFYLAVKDHKRICEDIPNDALLDSTSPEAQEYDPTKLERAKASAYSIIEKFFTPGAERELNIPSHILKPIVTQVTEQNNLHPDVFRDALDTILTMVRLSSFPNFYKAAILKGPITLKYTITQILEDQLLPPVSLKDFHSFLIREHSEENIEFYMSLRKYQQLCEKLPSQVLSGRATTESCDAKLMEQCKSAVSDLISRFIAVKSPQELNVPPSIRAIVCQEVSEKKNIHPDIFKVVLENVITTLKLASFPKFQKQVVIQINVDESFAVKSTTGVTLPLVEEVQFQLLEVTDTSSRAAISNRILSRLAFQTFTFDDNNDSTNGDRVNAIWKVTGESNSDRQFADMVTPAQLKYGLQQTLEDKIPPPLSCRDFRTYLKKEKKAHLVDFYLAVKRYKRICEKIPEGILNNPANAVRASPISSNPPPAATFPTSPTISGTVPAVPSLALSPTTSSTLPTSPTSPLLPTLTLTTTNLPTPATQTSTLMIRVKTELNEIISKYIDTESRLHVNVPSQIKLFLDSEVNKNGNWTPRIFDAAVQHVCLNMQRSSFPAFYKLATTKAKGVKLKIVGTKKTSKGDKKGSTAGTAAAATITGGLDEAEDDEMQEWLELDCQDGSSGGKLSMLLFQVLADKTSPPLSRNDFYIYLKKEHSQENFDFYMSVINYRKICKRGSETEIKDAAVKIIETFLLSNGEREVCLPSKVKTAILKSIQIDNNYSADIFNDAFLEVLSIMRVSSFPRFFEENSKDYGDDAGLHTIVPDDLLHREGGKEADMAKEQDPLILQVLQNRLASPLSLADFYNFLLKSHTERDLEFILLMEHYRKHCKDIPEFVLRNGVTVHSSRNELHAMTVEISEKFLRGNSLRLGEATLKRLVSKLNDEADYHPDVFEEANKFVMERLRNTSIPAFYTQGLETEKGW
ncbi:Regulator of G-protein signaling 20 [Chytriomyces hyalinus]|nr:Regulator of G-protein signaling 20 [Chytriomyces hyalinus]